MACLWLNAGSLFLGLAAWLLPLLALAWPGRNGKRAALLTAGSLGACALSLCFAVFYLGRLADIGDRPALEGAAGAFRLCAGVPLAGTPLLDIPALARQTRRM